MENSLVHTSTEPSLYGDTQTIKCSHGYQTLEGNTSFDIVCDGDSQWTDVQKCLRK